MYLPVPPQPDCASGWLAAARLVDQHPGHEARNVIIDVADPTARAEISDPLVEHVNEFLANRGKSVETISNTIFPRSLYQRHGSSTFVEVFHESVLPKIRGTKKWSGYYFERMTRYPFLDGSFDQLGQMIERMKKGGKALNKYEIALFDPSRDLNDSVYGGQCLSFLSFHLLPGNPRTLVLTAQYRNHYYIEKLMGHLIGLGRLMAYVAKEAELRVGALTVVSTHAQIDMPSATRSDIETLLNSSATEGVGIPKGSAQLLVAT